MSIVTKLQKYCTKGGFKRWIESCTEKYGILAQNNVMPMEYELGWQGTDMTGGALLLQAEQTSEAWGYLAGMMTARLNESLAREKAINNGLLDKPPDPGKAVDSKSIKPPEWNDHWEWRYPEANKPNAQPRWFDPNGGEWRWHSPDKWHSDGHWDYNPWDAWNSGWQNIYPSERGAQTCMRDTNTTIIDFYHGAYGPTIRIDVQNPEWLQLFRNLVEKLKDGNVSTLDLLGLDNVIKDEISGLKLISGSESSLSCNAPMQPGTYAAFVWTVNAEGIKHIAEAIDGLIGRNKPGHYYLYETNQILIELAYKE